MAADVRAISAGLRLPELERLSVEEAASRTIDDHQRRSGTRIERTLEPVAGQAPLPIKIALVRTLQEALSNATRHGRGRGVKVALSATPEQLQLRVSDRGPGFDPHGAQGSGRLGLAGMRERAEMLGGRFDVDSSVGSGTTVLVSWPVSANLQV